MGYHIWESLDSPITGWCETAWSFRGSYHDSKQPLRSERGRGLSERMRIGTALVCMLVPLPRLLRGGELGLSESVHTNTTPPECINV